MQKIRVYANYKTVDRPWGGANNFLLALEKYWAASGKIEYAARIDDEYDLLFLNAIGTGPGRTNPRKRALTTREIRRLKLRGRSRFWDALVRPGTPKKIVYRSINLEKWTDLRPWLSRQDRRMIAAMNMADHVILQTAYMLPVFRAEGYSGNAFTVIHNGADPQFFHSRGREYWDGRTRLKVLSCSFSNRASKQFTAIEALSRLPHVECTHVGNWPANVASGAVRQAGVLDRAQVGALMRASHVLMHPAIRDACPNVVQEALACGLPVLHARDSGSAELAGACGIAIDDGLECALDELRSHYPELIARIHEGAHRVSVERAAEQYLAVFNTVAAQPPLSRFSSKGVSLRD